ncbi:rhamnosyltransferase [Pasteurellaceae bacterium LFhippo2]|nr:rhamnosyltransferase [Pasteurellaceae bacterium LFhippo2]
MKLTLIVPTYNAGPLWQKWITAYQQQSIQADEVIVIDSSSQDQTLELAKQAGFTTYLIPSAEFNHGGTRNQAVKLAEKNADILVFLTQDAIFADIYALENLIKPFADPKVSAVCGRQLPHLNANPLAIHARLFNYPEQSQIKTKNDIENLGIKVAFMSNSFAAYRKSVFEELEGFPENTILAEDMNLTAKMILAGYKVAYCAEALVYHSHNYSVIQEFKRYFDTGVFQQNQSWIQDSFGKASNEGKRFVKSELQFLLKNSPLWIPISCLTILAKFVGFKCGLNWQKIPTKFISLFTMHKAYWKQQ